MTKTRHSSRAAQLLWIVAAAGCSADTTTDTSPQRGIAGQGASVAGQPPAAAAGQGAGVAGRGATVAPIPGMGTMTMVPPPSNSGGPTSVTTGAAGAAASAGNAAIAGTGPAAAGSAGQAGAAVIGGAGSHAGAAGAAGSGMPSGAGMPGSTAPVDMMDPTSVCAGGKPGMDSDAAMTRGMTSSRNYAVLMYIVKAPNTITRLQTILPAPKLPSAKSTLFIWPGLQHSGGADPGRVGNGVLQPVLTWGPSCSPKARGKGSDYMGWWISAMYVNISTSAAGPGGCAGGDAMDIPVGDRVYMDFSVKGNAWTQTVVNLNNMKKVDFTIDLKGQDQNWAIWDIETPGSSRPAEDTYFEKSVLTFASPVTSCQPTSAAEVDAFTAPILSPDGMHCCFEKITLKAKR